MGKGRGEGRMELSFCSPASRRVAAFTMVEIAISLAVIAFALVAIIGVLPSGMTAQRENREETIINQDASIYIDAIRNGARGMDHLTNYVYAILNHWTEYQIQSNAPTDILTNVNRSGLDAYYDTNSDIQSIASPPVIPLTNGLRIIGLMSRPKYEVFPTSIRSNFVVAYARAQSGVASEKPPQANADVRADSFAYRVICDNQKVQVYSDPVPLPAGATNVTPHLTHNLRELRLTFGWPLNALGKPGNGRQTYRMEVGGNLQTITDPFVAHPLFFFRPTTFVKAP